MAAKKKNKDSKAWMIPEGETRDKATHHFVARKSISMIREGKKLKMRKYHPKQAANMFGLLKQRCLATVLSN
jgi:hypothetical protein